MPKVSVIIPVYNVEKYLRECLDSVVNQTLTDIEIICVNDGSTDNSLFILQEYADKDKRIVLISRENRGVARTRNEGIKKAAGEFIAFMDPDDFYPDKDVLECLYKNAVEHEVKICGGEFVFYKNGEISQEFGELDKKYLFSADGIIKYSDYQFDFGYHRFIYQKDLIVSNNIYFPEYKYYEDPIFFVKAMHFAKEFYVVDLCTYLYRIGHKPFKLDSTQIKHYLLSAKEIIDISRKAGYKELEKLEISRFKMTYIKQCSCGDILKNLCLIWGFIESCGKYELLISVLNKFLKNIMQSIFSIKNEHKEERKYKIITILGIKIRVKGK